MMSHVRVRLSTDSVTDSRMQTDWRNQRGALPWTEQRALALRLLPATIAFPDALEEGEELMAGCWIIALFIALHRTVDVGRC